MAELEGVIKYHLQHRPEDLPAGMELAPLNAWRSLLHRLELIGQNPEKYQGLAYGNISRRLVPGSAHFIISGTQTGDLPLLDRQQFTIVTEAAPEENRLSSTGPCRPSSEALTHACIYQQAPAVQAVIHVHSAECWRQTHALNLAHIDRRVAYGTPEMARETVRLFQSGQVGNNGIFSMLGHEDGIVACGESLEAAASLLVSTLARAISLELGV